MTVTTCGAGQVRVPLRQVLASKLVFEDGLAGEVSTVPRRGSGAARQPSETTHPMASAMTRRSARELRCPDGQPCQSHELLKRSICTSGSENLDWYVGHPILIR
jgi:hypothetical protein